MIIGSHVWCELNEEDYTKDLKDFLVVTSRSGVVGLLGKKYILCQPTLDIQEDEDGTPRGVTVYRPIRRSSLPTASPIAESVSLPE